jgi:hypothetical protein
MVRIGLMGGNFAGGDGIFMSKGLKAGCGGRMDRQDNGHVKVFVTQPPINEQS